MPVENIHTYLVYPRSGESDVGQITGNSVPLEGQMFELLREIYLRSEQECTIGIAFRQGINGEQENPCRTLLTHYAAQPDIDRGRLLAERLALATTHRSGLGLMFILRGQEEASTKIVISRFRANNGVLVDEAPDAITVEFIDRVFMKNAHSYKAVCYRDESLTAGFWNGIAVDKQINSRDADTSNYWVSGFLNSEFSTTAALGTRRLALALKDAANNTDSLHVKQQITAAASLAGSLVPQPITAQDFFDRFGFSEETVHAVTRSFKRHDLIGDNFFFDSEEFRRQLPYKTVELNSGAVLTARASNFNDVFHTEEAENGEIIFSTTGQVISEKLEKRK